MAVRLWRSVLDDGGGLRREERGFVDEGFGALGDWREVLWGKGRREGV